MKCAPLVQLTAIAAGLLAQGALVAESRPDGAAEQKLVEDMREVALAYDSKLPDFICTQITHREVKRDSLPSGVSMPSGRMGGSRGAGGSYSPGPIEPAWRTVDTIQQQLTYFNHKETYKLVSVDGKEIADDQPPPGVSSTGEFGTTLFSIFHPKSHAEFKWKRWDKLRGKPVYVFSFSIAKENSLMDVGAGSDRIVVGYHGLLYVERETNNFMRVTTEAEIPHDFPLQNVKHLLDYGPVTIGGERYLLPLRSEMESRGSEDFVNDGTSGGSSEQANFRNTIDFKAYRKYGVESTLKPE